MDPDILMSLVDENRLDARGLLASQVPTHATLTKTWQALQFSVTRTYTREASPLSLQNFVSFSDFSDYRRPHNMGTLGYNRDRYLAISRLMGIIYKLKHHKSWHGHA